MRVAVLGLGIIGSRAAAHLRRNPDHKVTLWNRTPKGAEGEAASLEEATQDAEVILMYLKDAPAVREVTAAILRSASKEAVLLNHSTVDLATTRWLATECEIQGWGFLDAPFTGSKEAAAGAALVYYVAGDAGLIAKLTPLLHETGKEVIPCGDIGRATVIKLVTNLISAITAQALAEALATATRHGIDAETLTKAIAGNACGSPLAAMKLPSMAGGDFAPHFSLENMLKDSRYALELADGLDTPAIRAVSDRMAALCAAGLGGFDFSSLASPYLKP